MCRGSHLLSQELSLFCHHTNFFFLVSLLHSSLSTFFLTLLTLPTLFSFSIWEMLLALVNWFFQQAVAVRASVQQHFIRLEKKKHITGLAWIVPMATSLLISHDILYACAKKSLIVYMFFYICVISQGGFLLRFWNNHFM